MQQNSPSDIAFALQGGGAFGAFTWGALDALLEQGVVPRALCGVSSGALNAVALAQGLVRGGPTGARAELRLLWERIAGEIGWSSQFEPPGIGLARNTWRSSAIAWRRLIGPLQPDGIGPASLASVIARTLDRSVLTSPDAPAVTVAATDVETGAPRFFGNAEIDEAALLASGCLPMLIPAVQIGGRAYWDGVYSGNPPLAPLLAPAPPRTLVLVRAAAERVHVTPVHPTEILFRIQQIAPLHRLRAELAALPPSTELVDIADDAVFAALPPESHLMPDGHLIERLFEAGRRAASPARFRRAA